MVYVIHVLAHLSVRSRGDKPERDWSSDHCPLIFLLGIHLCGWSCYLHTECKVAKKFNVAILAN